MSKHALTYITGIAFSLHQFALLNSFYDYLNSVCMKSSVTKFTLLICLLYTGTACNNSLPVNASNSTPKQVVSNYDKESVSSIYEDCIYTVKLAEEAILRGTSVETKTFASNLLGDYKQMMQQIEDIARAKSIELPMDMRDKQLKKWREMVKETGWSFDKKFIELAMDENNQTQTLIKNISTAATDQDIRKTAGDILSYTNQDLAKQVQEVIKSRTQKDSIIQTVVITQP
jgi:predicted outer membrane protein